MPSCGCSLNSLLASIMRVGRWLSAYLIRGVDAVHSSPRMLGVKESKVRTRGAVLICRHGLCPLFIVFLSPIMWFSLLCPVSQFAPRLMFSLCSDSNIAHTELTSNGSALWNSRSSYIAFSDTSLADITPFYLFVRIFSTLLLGAVTKLVMTVACIDILPGKNIVQHSELHTGGEHINHIQHVMQLLRASPLFTSFTILFIATNIPEPLIPRT